MKISLRDGIIIVVIALLLFGGVSLEADSLKFDQLEAQHIELQVKGVMPRTQQ
ncbi:hypothetical protein [Yokenella regensburgei]|uniref:Uncharacterized protein n=1 Tax=Yokenella regensburgei TaxID=158877 RepID=A0AB38FVH8_9ENTR|nr:hypothetical protein [Yokenella regensburgei]KFD25225.1 hypothetical protein GYRE_00276 [Yokenella regensburgei ATCC 49455]SQA63259.1 Uncharacterised protein [Yokenella regensburgei]SQA68679.1 Uncharacterised protein [Yokenella regensburgei]SUQ06994.1 Uncharacterised protein [Yokenella regensburgei]